MKKRALGWMILFPVFSFAQTPLAEQLVTLQNRISIFEQSLLEGLNSRQNIHEQVKKIQKLLKFQKLERQLGLKRQEELEHIVQELETRRKGLQGKIAAHQAYIRRSLRIIEAATRDEQVDRFREFHLPEQERFEAPKRRVLSKLVHWGLKEAQTLRVDLADAIQLGNRIQDEQHQLAYLFQDLKEQESVLELNRHIQMDFLKTKRQERVGQLENYRKLKNSEAQVEHLIKNFNTRAELATASLGGAFSNLKGKLPFPVAGGKVLSAFGRAFDPRSGLYVFKKGIDIEVDRNQPVRAVSSGKIAFSGILPNYGKVIIVDHGNHFYSLCAHLGAISKKANEVIQAGETLGLTAEVNTPLYFEIRARNVAVNPLQWVFN